MTVAFQLTSAVGRRPDLWRTALRQIRLLAAPGWWRRPPFLPVPPGPYLRFRLQTAYGGDGRGPIRSDDVITYLEWCRTFARLTVQR